MDHHSSHGMAAGDPIPIESAWVEKIKEGNGDAFEKLFRLYCQPLINFAKRYVVELAIAENLVQDVFLRVWKNRARLDPALSIKTYLYTSVKNQALKHLKHVAVEQKSQAELDQPPSTDLTPESSLTEKELAASIDQAIAQLPEKCRLIFTMNRFDRLTYAEIARVENISIKTVETQMGRALKFLRKSLSHFLTAFPF